MKFLIVDKRKRVGDIETAHYAVQRIQEELDKEKITYEFCHFDEIEVSCDKDRFELSLMGKPLSEFSHIIPRGHRKQEYKIKQYLALYCDNNGIKLQNSEFIKFMTHYNKLFQLAAISQAGLPYLDSFYTQGGQYHKNSIAIDKIGFPMIYKHIEGEYRIEKIEGENKLKKNVFLINNIEELKDQCTSRKDPGSYFIQKFADIGEDYRSIVIGGKFFAAWKRTAPEKSFLTVTKGSKYELYDKPSKEFMDLTEKITALFRADYCAIDTIQDSGKLYVLEINQSPGFKAFETKIEGGKFNVAKAIVESMIEQEG